MFILGLDIGYSNLKIAYGVSGFPPSVRILPSGAIPMSSVNSAVSVSGMEGIKVNVDGEDYLCCVHPEKLENWTRVLHDDFPESADYKALFIAALSIVNRPIIDCLVVGLPVDQYFDKNRREALQRKLEGNHRNGLMATYVRQVIVVPQPIGGYMDMLSANSAANLHEQRVLVCDPGFFSMDWVLVQDGQVRKQASGSSRLASSVVLEEASRLIFDEFGAKVSRERIEWVIQKGSHDMPFRGKSLDIGPFLKQASEKVSSMVVNEILDSLRREKTDADVVLMVGGGADYFGVNIKESLGDAMWFKAENPALANARGFWHYGASN